MAKVIESSFTMPLAPTMANKTRDKTSWSHLNPNDFGTRVDELEFSGLPPILPCFFVPSLLDKPQNPIVENIKLSEKNREPAKDFSTIRSTLPLDLPIITENLVPSGPDNKDQPKDPIWNKLDLHWHSRKVRALYQYPSL
jgi:hypothetical protein